MKGANMNKTHKHVVLVGLLGVLLMPGVAHAQLGKAVRQGGRAAKNTVVTTNIQEHLYALEQSLTAALQRAAVASNASSILYVPREGITLPDFHSRRYIKQFQEMCITEEQDWQHISPLYIAQQAAKFSREPWIILALNYGANPTKVLYTTITQNPHLARILLRNYGLNPNGKLEDGTPLISLLVQYGNVPDWFLDWPGLDLNIIVNDDPLIFSTLSDIKTPTNLSNLLVNSGSPYILKDYINQFSSFTKILARINPWEVTNKNHANFLHELAEIAPLEKILPEDFQIPQEHLNKRDGNGDTYLHRALKGKFRAYNVPYLLERGVDPAIANHLGQTSIDIINQQRTFR